MRSFSKFYPRFWVSGPGKKFRKDPETQLLCVYLFTAPSSNMIGLYYLPITAISHDTGLSEEGAWKGLQRASEGAFCSYDRSSEVIWVHEMAKIQVLDGAEKIKRTDNKIKAIKKELFEYEYCPFFRGFIEYYNDILCLDMEEFLEPLRSPSEAPPKPLRRGSLKEQEQETEREREGAPPPPPLENESKELPDWRQPPVTWASVYLCLQELTGFTADPSYHKQHLESIARQCLSQPDPVAALEAVVIRKKAQVAKNGKRVDPKWLATDFDQLLFSSPDGTGEDPFANDQTYQNLLRRFEEAEVGAEKDRWQVRLYNYKQQAKGV